MPLSSAYEAFENTYRNPLPAELYEQFPDGYSASMGLYNKALKRQLNMLRKDAKSADNSADIMQDFDSLVELRDNVRVFTKELQKTVSEDGFVSIPKMVSININQGVGIFTVGLSNEELQTLHGYKPEDIKAGFDVTYYKSVILDLNTGDKYSVFKQLVCDANGEYTDLEFATPELPKDLLDKCKDVLTKPDQIVSYKSLDEVAVKVHETIKAVQERTQKGKK